METWVCGYDQTLKAWIPIGVDQRSGGLLSISSEHGHIHAGTMFAHGGIHAGLVNDGVANFLLSVPAGHYPHLRVMSVMASGAPIWLEVYEAPTVTAIGVAEVFINKNRNSVNTAAVLLYSGTTVSANGTIMDATILPGGKSVGGAAEAIEDELVLKPGLQYLIKVTNKSGATQDYSLCVVYYEPIS